MRSIGNDGVIGQREKARAVWRKYKQAHKASHITNDLESIDQPAPREGDEAEALTIDVELEQSDGSMPMPARSDVPLCDGTPESQTHRRKEPAFDNRGVDRISVGMDVETLEGERFGRVTHVGTGTFQVTKGLLLKKQYSLTLDEVACVGHGRIFLNVSMSEFEDIRAHGGIGTTLSERAAGVAHRS